MMSCMRLNDLQVAMHDIQMIDYPIAISDAPLCVYVSEAMDVVERATEDQAELK